MLKKIANGMAISFVILLTIELCTRLDHFWILVHLIGVYLTIYAYIILDEIENGRN